MLPAFIVATRLSMFLGALFCFRRRFCCNARQIREWERARRMNEQHAAHFKHLHVSALLTARHFAEQSSDRFMIPPPPSKCLVGRLSIILRALENILQENANLFGGSCDAVCSNLKTILAGPYEIFRRDLQNILQILERLISGNCKLFSGPRRIVCRAF